MMMVPRPYSELPHTGYDGDLAILPDGRQFIWACPENDPGPCRWLLMLTLPPDIYDTCVRIWEQAETEPAPAENSVLTEFDRIARMYPEFSGYGTPPQEDERNGHRLTVAILVAYAVFLSLVGYIIYRVFR